METVRSHKAKQEGFGSLKTAVFSYLPFSLVFSFIRTSHQESSSHKGFYSGLSSTWRMKYRHIQIDRISALSVQSIYTQQKELVNCSRVTAVISFQIPPPGLWTSQSPLIPPSNQLGCVVTAHQTTCIVATLCGELVNCYGLVQCSR